MKLDKEQMDYGELIKKIRLESGLTQGEVARQLEVTPGYISNVEKGRTSMSLKLLIYYARIMGVSIDSLVGGLEVSYKETAIDNDIKKEIQKMDVKGKKKLLEILKVINEE